MSASAAASDVIVCDEDGDDLKDEDCQKLIDEFVSITDTNDAIGQMFLQQRQWKLPLAVNDYFEQIAADPGPKSAPPGKLVELSSDSDADADDERSPPPKKKTRTDDQAAGDRLVEESAGTSSEPSVPSDRRELIFVTWNIDGLSPKNLKIRVEAVVKLMKQIRPDVLFLQEVIPESEAILRDQLSEYSVFSGRTWKGFDAEYYTLTLVRKETVKVVSNEVIDYTLSVMTRNVILTKVQCSGITVNLLNTHLESTKEYSSHRLKQLIQLGQIVKGLPVGEASVIAGDLNMRDKELEESGGLPEGWIDVWEKTGRRAEVRYTWDMLRNDNLDTNFGKFKPRCRFDRVLVRDTSPSSISPQSFSLIGIERLKPHVCFPSDHWGILTVFQTSSRT